MLAAAANGATVDGVHLDDVRQELDDANKNDPGMKLATAIIDQYARRCGELRPGRREHRVRAGDAWTFVYALQHAGKNPTRAGLMKALKNMNTTANPFVYPGHQDQDRHAKDNFPLEQLSMIKWGGGATGDWQPFGRLLNGDPLARQTSL